MRVSSLLPVTPILWINSQCSATKGWLDKLRNAWTSESLDLGRNQQVCPGILFQQLIYYPQVDSVTGWVMCPPPERSRDAVRINLAKCFLEMSAAERERLVGRSLKDMQVPDRKCLRLDLAGLVLHQSET